MITETKERHIKEMDTILNNLEKHVNMCSKAVLDDAIIIGRHFSEFKKEDLEKLYSITHRFYHKCVCTKTDTEDK